MGTQSLRNSSLDKGYEEVHGAMRFYNGVFDLVREVRGSSQEKQSLR